VRRGIGLGLLAACLLAGCAGDGGDDDGGGSAPPSCTPAVDPAGAPRYASNIQPIYDRSCAVAGCHSSVAPAQGLDLSAGRSYAATVDKRSTQILTLQMVEPGNVDDSYLVQKIRGDAGIAGVLMPQGCPGNPLQGALCLTPDEIDAIETWILACAPNN
jgi:hypothetical protein